MNPATHTTNLRVLPIFALVFATTGFLFALGGQNEPANLALRSQLAPVATPDLSGLDPAVAEQLTKARSEMEAEISDLKATPGRLAAAYGTLGQLYHAYEFFDEALACYGNASLLEPGDFNWHHLQGDAFRKLGNLEAAAAQFEAAWALEPRDFAALVALGEVYLGLSRDDDAEKAFRSALAMSPGSPSVMAGLGELALRRQNYEDAVSYFGAALTSVPAANQLHYSLAMAYRGLGQMDKAKEHLEKRGMVGLRASDPVVDSLQLLKRGERVHLVRGRLAFASERFEEARDEFALAVAADPSSVRALVNLGATQAKLGETEEAIRLLRRAVELEPESLSANFNLGSLLANRGDFKEAVPRLQEAVKQAPHDFENQYLLAQALVGVGDDYASLTHFEQASKLDPANEFAVIDGAATLIRLNQYHRALPVLDAGLERMPDSGLIAMNLARLLAACPDGEIRDGERALDLATRVFEAVSIPRHAQIVAQALAELGRCDEAAAWQQSIVDAAVKEGVTEALPALRADLEMYLTGPPCRVPVTR